MFSSRFTRARRLAACTALAVSAGMLLATPASAGSPAPRPGVETDRSAAEQPLMPSTPTAAKTDARVAGTEGAALAGAGPRSDVDGDGLSDLVVRESDGTLSLVTQTEATEFLRTGGKDEFTKDIIPIGDQDLNGGRPEILTLSVLGSLEMFGDVSTTEVAQRRWTAIGGGFHVYNKVFSPGDVNGDRRADLMARAHTGELFVFLATGDRTSPFMGRVQVGSGWQVYDQIVGIGDNDGDGKGDVLTRTPAGDVSFHGSTGDALKPFKAPRSIGFGWDIYNQILPVDDQDGDGDTEIWARLKSGTMRAYGGSGTGSYDTRENISDSGAWAWVSQFGGAGNMPAHGKEEMLAIDKAGSLYWYYARNNGLLSLRQHLDTGWGGANITNVSSFDPNGEADLVEIWNGRLYVEGKDVGGGWNAFNLLAGPGDLNGDATGDLLARDRSGNLYLYPTTRTGTSFHARTLVSGGWQTYNWFFGAGDYTNDGRSDLLARTTTGTLYLFPGTGSRTAPFKGRIKLGEGFNAYTKLVGTGDLTGDGKGDFVAATPSGDLYRFDGGAAKSYFAPRVKIGYGYQAYNGLY
ncbi:MULTISPECIES: VCBS repeat-containing protein [unclassified Streptomyces]|uniref:FG-GAP repeat domain-containing protein n=1 Tax=unclassified Streptomyces TaxID=2593676 RepID=UPI001E29D4C0|nr:VCBS repeat-containing protein [Streptomyces sp. CB02980]MCB8906298.1 VCBS repeat-containing protein [Streptomyces sp. CB02980]